MALMDINNGRQNADGLAEFVDDDGEAAVVAAQDVVENAGLSRAQIPGQDRDGDAGIGGRLHRVTSRASAKRGSPRPSRRRP